MADGAALRLIAEDAEDLQVISASLQDSVLKAENMRYDPRRRRFSLELNRYRWEVTGEQSRIRAILAIDGVLGVRRRAVTVADPDLVYSLLSLSFVPDAEPPGGKVSLLFAGDGEVELIVESIDATLLDSDYEWSTRRRPDHEKRRR
ncbi:MAG: DUF2948 family protein [Pseudomonadota bacterium]